MVKVMEMSNGQKLVTLPKGLCVALGIEKGDRIRFILNRKGNMEIERDE